jgi:hypothetical protein
VKHGQPKAAPEVNSFFLYICFDLKRRQILKNSTHLYGKSIPVFSMVGKTAAKAQVLVYQRL